MSRSDGVLRLLLACLMVALTATAWELGSRDALPGRGGDAFPMVYLRPVAVHQLTLARGRCDIQRILGDLPAADAAAALKESYTLDSLLFIPLYAAVLLVVIELTRRGQARVSGAAVLALQALLMAVVVADLLENRSIAAVGAHLSGAALADVPTGYWPYALVKWALLAVLLGVLGVVNSLQAKRARRAFGAVLMASSMVVGLEVVTYAIDRVWFYPDAARGSCCASNCIEAGSGTTG
jgi:hypothetical protein